jgi:hypothetical protein
MPESHRPPLTEPTTSPIGSAKLQDDAGPDQSTDRATTGRIFCDIHHRLRCAWHLVARPRLVRAGIAILVGDLITTTALALAVTRRTGRRTH